MGTGRRTRWFRARRWSLAGPIALAALGLLSYSASATFSSSATATHVTSTGDMEITVGVGGTSDNRLTVGHTYVPNTTARRQAKLTIENDDGTMSAVKLTVTGDNGPPSFVSDTTDGLKLWIARCTDPGGWSESGTSPDFTYTCDGAGDQLDVLGTSGAPLPVLQAGASLTNLDLSDGAENYLLVTLSLPASAPTSMQNESSDLTFTWNGEQRGGTNR